MNVLLIGFPGCPTSQQWLLLMCYIIIEDTEWQFLYRILFIQTDFWLLLMKHHAKRNPNVSLWYFFCLQCAETDQKATQKQLPLISFLYSILSNNLLLSGLKSPSLFYFMTAWQIYGVDIVLSCRLLNIRVPRKIIFLRVKM